MQKEAKVTVFTTGNHSIGDGIFLALKCKETEPEKIREWLRNNVPYNGTLVELVAAIKAHKCPNRKIVRHDNAAKVHVGFKCIGCEEQWYVPLPDLKACVNHHPEFREVMRTNESREALAEELTSFKE